MKNKSIQQLLLSSRPKGAHGNQAFVERTMQAVREAGTAEAFNVALRYAERLPKRSLFMRYRHLPKYAMVLVAVAGILLVSGTAYAAIHWLEPLVNITSSSIDKQENKREYRVDVKNCGIEVGGETVDNGHQVFEVANDVKLSDAQIKKVIGDSCNYQQMLDTMNTRWPNDPRWPINPPVGESFTSIEPGTGGNNVLNDPWIGTITGLNSGHIQITATLYEEYTGPSVVYAGQTVPDPATMYKYYPTGKKVVHDLDLAPDAQVVDSGRDSSVSQLKVGDTVLFMSEVQRTVIAGGHWSDPSSVKVARLIKADIDPANVMNMGVGNPLIVGGINRLEGCQGNGKYLCLASKPEDIEYGLVYSYTGNTETPTPSKLFTGNEKYFRKDIDLNKAASDYYHQIDGRVTAIDGASITLQPRGKTGTFTVTFPYDAVKAYNQSTPLHLDVGDMVTAGYMQKSDEDHTQIKPGDVMSLSLVERRMPDGTLVKY
jgi:hypothetical protein